ncbi:MAG: MBL fold metallo-hydrolase [Dehalococcoidia bacterium]|jgi:L-ascorbate metabolism protein UlaG (beta-lactamase superfamily)|nr:MBL fold metallo-hydrolase [Dehalococcoidia bacterium]
MKVKWLGHACFLLTSESGLRIITDPYTPGVYGLDYAPPAETADIVTVSHDHADHNNVAAVKGNPQVVRGVGSHEAKGIQFKGIATAHDESSGKERGANTIFCFTLDGINVCHLGDVGHDLSDSTVAAIGDVDLLLIPVGGNFTIDAALANRLCQKLAPKVVIPMHFKNARCPGFPVTGVDDFTRGRQQVKTIDGSEIELKKGQLPTTTETIVLKPAL